MEECWLQGSSILANSGMVASPYPFNPQAESRKMEKPTCPGLALLQIWDANDEHWTYTWELYRTSQVPDWGVPKVSSWFRLHHGVSLGFSLAHGNVMRQGWCSSIQHKASQSSIWRTSDVSDTEQQRIVWLVALLGSTIRYLCFFRSECWNKVLLFWDLDLLCLSLIILVYLLLNSFQWQWVEVIFNLRSNSTQWKWRSITWRGTEGVSPHWSSAGRILFVICRSSSVSKCFKVQC